MSAPPAPHGPAHLALVRAHFTDQGITPVRIDHVNRYVFLNRADLDRLVTDAKAFLGYVPVRIDGREWVVTVALEVAV